MASRIFPSSSYMSCCGNIAVGLADDEVIPSDLKETMGRSTAVIRHCDVCFLLDNDLTPKETMYCKMCDAFMCTPCRNSKWRRLGASISRTMRKLLKGK
jgi:hypothetical protein